MGMMTQFVELGLLELRRLHQTVIDSTILPRIWHGYVSYLTHLHCNRRYFYRVMLCRRKVTVRLSVTRRYSVETAKHIFELFSTSGNHTILVFSQPSIYIDGWLYGMSMTSVVSNVPVLSQNDSTYHHSVFTT